jgi:uncharacterized protein
MRLQCLFIQSTESKGRGIFTNKLIAADTVIEIAPVIVMSGEERKLLDATKLHDYIFEWGEQKNQCCMALGWVPVYNHAAKSNCEYFMDYENETMFIKTVRSISAGDELTINYNGDWDDEKAVWFETE